jgi:perosamine synthetase
MSGQYVRSFYPKIDEIDIAAVSDAAKNGWGDKRNQYIERMEVQLSQITNQEFAIAVSHGTAAITLALASLELNPGDEVIVPDLTWVACAAPIIQLGLTPVFVNADDSLCMMPESFERAITNRTRAVIVVDLAGSLPDWERINEIARNHDLFVIEDAAESLGAKYKGMPAGQFGDISILSFSGTKVVTGGQGGAILTSNPELYKKIKLLYHHGIDQALTGKYYWSHELGYNFQISNIQAALISSQLNRLDQLVDYKKWLFNTYQHHLSPVVGIELAKAPEWVESSYWLIVARFDPELGISKEQFIKLASERGIDIRPFFYLLSDMPPFSTYNVEESVGRKITVQMSQNMVCLPYGYDMTEEKVIRTVQVVQEILESHGA